MAAPLTSSHRNLQTHQPFYPALDYTNNSTTKGTEYLVKTPINLPAQPVPIGPIVGIKILDQTYPADNGNTVMVDRYNRLAVTSDGLNWTPISTPDNVNVVTVLNVPNTTSYVLETDVGILYTSPNGLNWTLVDMTQSDNGFFKLLSFAGDYLWATSYTRPAELSPVDNWNNLYTSDDEGVTWNLVYSTSGFANPEGFRGIVYGYGLEVTV